MKSAAELIAGVLFGLMALVHLGRLLCPFNVTFGEFQVPLWPSAVFFIFAGLLSAWLFRGHAH